MTCVIVRRDTIEIPVTKKKVSVKIYLRNGLVTTSTLSNNKILYRNKINTYVIPVVTINEMQSLLIL